MATRKPKSAPSAEASAERRPEHWEEDVGDGDVARLIVPADLLRDRSFEIFCSLAVDARGNTDATMSMRVLVDGSQQWQRQEPVHAGGRDSLDYRFRRELPAGQPLRIQASTEVAGARRLRLRITADED
jgi:hypothetical protein